MPDLNKRIKIYKDVVELLKLAEKDAKEAWRRLCEDSIHGPNVTLVQAEVMGGLRAKILSFLSRAESAAAEAECMLNILNGRKAAGDE